MWLMERAKSRTAVECSYTRRQRLSTALRARALGSTKARGQVRLGRVESAACGVMRGVDPPTFVDVNANIEVRLTGQEGIMVVVRGEGDTDWGKGACENSIENGMGGVECSIIGVTFVPYWCTKEH